MKLAKRFMAILMAIAFVIGAQAASATVEHCPDHNGHPGKVEGNFNSLVLDAGTSFCVKAGGEASGMLTADGQTSLSGYVTWTNNGGNRPNVSYYIIYEQSTTTTTVVEETTTTTQPEVTTTTVVEETTTTTQPEVTTTTVAPTTTTTAVEQTTTTVGSPTTTTPATSSTMVELEVLPYTGLDPLVWLGIALLSAVLGGAALASSKRGR